MRIVERRIKRHKCWMLVKLNKKKQITSIMPAIKPDGTAVTAPRGWTWIPGWSEGYAVEFLK